MGNCLANPRNGSGCMDTSLPPYLRQHEDKGTVYSHVSQSTFDTFDSPSHNPWLRASQKNTPFFIAGCYRRRLRTNSLSLVSSPHFLDDVFSSILQSANQVDSVRGFDWDSSPPNDANHA